MIYKKRVSVDFIKLNQIILIELDNSKSPNTIQAILAGLPIKVKINRWGDELYTDKTPISADEENSQSVVYLSDVAYWPEGNAICLFLGPTPISKESDKILPYSPVNIIGRIITSSAHDILDKVEESTTVIIKAL
ncbi:MAG TPA: cyclophilin-like fold protein [Nitrososphaeraceae archaeon]|nr:cyclophilin-like fold protein [Nitrososphaeraceae archaeon]